MAILDQFGRAIDTQQLAKARRLMEAARRHDSLTAAYDAAQTTQENSKHWQWADHLSAAAANSVSVRKTLRQRSRYECLENNSYAKGIALTLANDTISTGPSLQVMLPDKEASRQIEKLWRAWCRDVRLAKKLRTARLSKIIDGETILLKVTNRRSRNPVQLDIRLIESDQLATPNFVDGLPNQVDGIEFDEYGNPVKYHILKGHPGDVWPFKAWEKDDIDPDDIIHLFRSERPGQQRGIPELTPALPLFAQIRRYTLAVILAAETAANLTAILKTQGNPYDSDTNGVDDVDPFDFVQIDRGLMTSLPRGWDMVQFRPEQPTTTYDAFKNSILNEVARCVHMPSNKARADSSNYNYSSGRLDHQTYYEAISVERSDWEVECLDRIFTWWLDEAFMLDGYLPALEAMDEIPHVWRWPPRKDVDPNEDADANTKLIDNGLKTRQQYLIEQNIDPEMHEEQLKQENWISPTQVELIKANVNKTAASPSDPGAPATAADGTDPASAPIDAAPAPTGEFANMSRLQLQRNMKGIDDAMNKLSTGEWTETRARVHLRSLGLQPQTIDDLLGDFVDPEQDSSDKSVQASQGNQPIEYHDFGDRSDLVQRAKELRLLRESGLTPS